MDKNLLSDEDLVKIIREKDKELYTEIISRYKLKLSHYLKKFTRDRDELDDILQVVFIKAYKNLYGFDTDKKFSSWIYRIAHNEALNVLKKNKGKVNLDDVEYKIIDDNLGPDDRMDKKILEKQTEEALGRIKSKYREPLILFFFEQKSYAEIAEILRLPINTVGTLIARGKKELKQKFNN